MTRRGEIIALLQQHPMSIREIAIHFRVPSKEIVPDIQHIKKSLLPHRHLVMTIPECRSCGYQFKKRDKLKRPSKCPACKQERITEPKFSIEAV